MEKPKLIGCLLLSIAGAAMNIAVCYVAQNTLSIPLFLDTVFTITVTLYGGIFWGVLTGALTNLAFHTIFFIGYSSYLYTLCNVAVAVLTAFFMRWFPRELSFGMDLPETSPRKSESLNFQNLIEKVIILTLFSFALCVAISIMGGICAALINLIEPSAYETSGVIDPGSQFRLALVRKGLPGILVEIGSRIPVNILDRLISSFVGYGAAWLLAVKFRRAKTGQTAHNYK